VPDWLDAPDSAAATYDRRITVDLNEVELLSPDRHAWTMWCLRGPLAMCGWTRSSWYVHQWPPAGPARCGRHPAGAQSRRSRAYDRVPASRQVLQDLWLTAPWPSFWSGSHHRAAGCGPCIGRHMECWGRRSMLVYQQSQLCRAYGIASGANLPGSPCTAAATALRGAITDPRDV